MTKHGRPRPFDHVERSHLGRLLTESRANAGLTIQRLRPGVGLSTEMVRRVMGSKLCTLETALRIGRALGLQDTLVAERWFLDQVEAHGIDSSGWLRRVKEG